MLVVVMVVVVVVLVCSINQVLLLLWTIPLLAIVPKFSKTNSFPDLPIEGQLMQYLRR